jgi:hypothetical protein
MEFFSLRGDLLISYASNYVKVWNFVTNMSVKFNVGDELFEQVVLNYLYY